MTACELNIPTISWEKKVSEVPAVAATISGVLFPFDVSVATDATHRLESENKLVALVASDIVNLEIFEGRLVEMVGFMKPEGKRNVFWVHSLDLKENLDDLIDESDLFQSLNQLLGSCSIKGDIRQEGRTFTIKQFSRKGDNQCYFNFTW